MWPLPICDECARRDPNYASADDMNAFEEGILHPEHPGNYGANE